MQLNRNQVAGINMKELIFHILYRWRSILIAALIGALALCGYQYLSIKKVHDAGKQTKEERQYQIDLQEYGEQLESSRNTIKVYSKLIQEQNAYLNDSIFMQLSPQSVWVASNKYLVKVDQSVLDALPQGSAIDPADSILPVYSLPLSEVTDEDGLKKAFGTDKTEYISELVSVDAKTSDNTITLYVMGETKETAEAGLSLLHEQMEKLEKGKAGEIAAHQLILISKQITRGIDKELSAKVDLAQRQESLAKTTEENQETLQDARQKLDKLEASGEPSAPGMHLPKMGVIGFVIGAALLIFIYAVSYVIRDRLNSSADLAKRYNLPVFGELTTSGHLHGLRGLDKLFSKCELGKDTLKEETVYDNIAALIAEKPDRQNVLLVSSLPENRLNSIRDALVKRLPEKKVHAQANFNMNSEAISEASKADAVIVVEAKRVSRMKDMDRMAENLIISEAKVIGAVVL